MTNTPLNPDALRAAEELMIRTDRITKINYLDAERIITAYLAVAQSDTQKLTDAEWQAFQAFPDQGCSHRAWVDARIAERVTAAQPVVNRVLGLPDNTVIEDSSGDVGIIMNGAVHYPETAELGIDYVSKKFGPFIIRHTPEVPGA